MEHETVPDGVHGRGRRHPRRYVDVGDRVLGDQEAAKSLDVTSGGRDEEAAFRARDDVAREVGDRS